MTDPRAVAAAPNNTNVVGPTPLTTPPFPSAYPSPLAPNGKMLTALTAAIAQTPSPPGWNAPICIAVLDPPAGPFPMAAVKGDDIKYGASMMKLAAVYTAFELRKTLRSIATELGTKASPTDLLQTAANYLKPSVMAFAAGSTGLKNIPETYALPQYNTTFTCTAGSPAVNVDFSAAYKQHQSKMISISSNDDAGASIHGVGYGMINGILQNAGFFSAATQSGLWLAGDYQDNPQGKYPYFRIPTANDGAVNHGPAAQSATVVQLVKLFALMWKRQLVDSGSSQEMLARFTESVAAGETFMTRASYFYAPQVPPFPWTVENTKLGIGPQGPGNGGPTVYSETCILKHAASGKEFVVAWQDFALSSLDPPSSPNEMEFQRVIDVALRTMNGFLTP
jgi:hypothetical protein